MGEKAVPDYGDYKVAPGENILVTIAAVARDQAEAEAEVARLEEELDQAKQRLRLISEETLPELMDNAEQTELRTKDGIQIKVGETVRASIPKTDPARASRCFKFIEDEGDERLIKRKFTIEFGREEEGWANKFERDLKQRKRPLNVKREKTVHPQTLAAYLKEKLELGVPLPDNSFSLQRQKVAKIKVETKAD